MTFGNWVCTLAVLVGVSLVPPALGSELVQAEPDNAVRVTAADVERIRERAESGDPQAQFHLGTLYQHGPIPAISQADATQWFYLAAEQGLVDAAYAYAIQHISGAAPNADPATGAVWLRRVIAARDPSYTPLAMANLGGIYLLGKGVPIDPVRAYMWTALAAAAGEQGSAAGNLQVLLRAMPPGQIATARRFARECLASDYQQCEQFMQITAANAVAADGSGGAGWTPTMVATIRQHAARGNPIAQTTLGKLSRAGYGVTQDAAEAVRWFTLAAEQGDAEAQVDLGRMYATGRGVAADRARAMHWVRRAARQHEAAAVRDLARMYSAGVPSEHDKERAAFWAIIALSFHGITSVDAMPELWQAIRAISPERRSTLEASIQSCVESVLADCGEPDWPAPSKSGAPR